MSKVYCAILAGGLGKRIKGYDVPKQFIELSGAPIIIHTLKNFLCVNRFEKILITINVLWKQYLLNVLKEHLTNDELKKIIIIDGGFERLDSFNNVINYINNEYGIENKDIIICQDAVRPFIKKETIIECIKETEINDFSMTVCPVVDTIHISNKDGFIIDALDRNTLFKGQTPSGFNMFLLKRILDKSDPNLKSKVTGISQLILKCGYHIKMINGDSSNIKITTNTDIEIASNIFKNEK